MRAHGTRAEQADGRSKPRRVSASSTPADRMLTLQRLAGNTAVSRAVEEERHAHGPGCGHAGAASAVQRRVSVAEAISSPGVRPETRILEKAQRGFGVSFDHVRLHTGPVAQRSAVEFEAIAYTSGSDIVSQKPHLDDETMLHEFGHVHQQMMGPVGGTDNGTGAKVSHKDHPLEKQAASNGRIMAQGGAPDLSLPGLPAPVQRSMDSPAAHIGPRPGASADHSVQRADAMEGVDPGIFSDAESLDYDEDSESEAWEKHQRVSGSHAAERATHPRATTPTPQKAAGFGTSTHGIRPDRVKTHRKGGPADPASPLKYRKDSALLYRWDTRPPEVILREGFTPWNEGLPKSLRLYQKYLQRSAFVSATRTSDNYVPEWARQPDGSAYRYVITAPGGLDMVDSLGPMSFTHQQEILFWKGIRPQFIARAETVDAGNKVVDSLDLAELRRRAAAGGNATGQANRAPAPSRTPAPDPHGPRLSPYRGPR